jgi:hypothetical protein
VDAITAVSAHLKGAAAVAKHLDYIRRVYLRVYSF